MFSRFFIDRPIFAAVLSIFIVLAGLAAMRTLTIAQYPEIAPPVVTGRAIYPGAEPEPRLPEEVRRQGVTVQKGSSAFLQVLAFYSPEGRYDNLAISNFVTLNV